MSSLSFEAALSSPCQGCPASCCTMLPLHDFTLNSFMDVDYARYVLNFDRIEIALLQGQKWRIHYQMTCSHLKNGLCDLHGSTRKPLVCQEYNPYQCFYKYIFHSEETPSYVRFDAKRFEEYAKHIAFDSHRRVVGLPVIDQLLEYLPPIDPIPSPDEPIPDFDFDTDIKKDMKAKSEWEIRENPCKGCEAWCCTRLLFPQPNPQWLKSIDHQRFILGFPGVQLGYSSSGWVVVVQAECQHRITDNKQGFQCGIFGQPERPITCQQYNGVGCAYRYQFGQANAADYIQINSEQFEEIAKIYRYDEHGAIIHAPQFDEIKAVCQASS